MTHWESAETHGVLPAGALPATVLAEMEEAMRTVMEKAEPRIRELDPNDPNYETDRLRALGLELVRPKREADEACGEYSHKEMKKRHEDRIKSFLYQARRWGLIEKRTQPFPNPTPARTEEASERKDLNKQHNQEMNDSIKLERYKIMGFMSHWTMRILTLPDGTKYGKHASVQKIREKVELKPEEPAIYSHRLMGEFEELGNALHEYGENRSLEIEEPTGIRNMRRDKMRKDVLDLWNSILRDDVKVSSEDCGAICLDSWLPCAMARTHTMEGRWPTSAVKHERSMEAHFGGYHREMDTYRPPPEDFDGNTRKPRWPGWVRPYVEWVKPNMEPQRNWRSYEEEAGEMVQTLNRVSTKQWLTEVLQYLEQEEESNNTARRRADAWLWFNRYCEGQEMGGSQYKINWWKWPLAKAIFSLFIYKKKRPIK